MTKSGLFRVHRIEERLYYEIPADALDTDLLWVTQISETTAGSWYRACRWAIAWFGGSFMATR